MEMEVVKEGMPIVQEFSNYGLIGLAYLSLFALVIIVLWGGWKREQRYMDEQREMRKVLAENTNILTELTIYIKGLNGHNKK